MPNHRQPVSVAVPLLETMAETVAVELTLTVQEGAVVAPARAVQTGQSGTFVFVIDSGLKARMQSVEVERTQEDQSIIAHGLSGGETVLLGLTRVPADGAAVQVVNEVAR